MTWHSITCEEDGWCYGLEQEARCCVCGAGLLEEHGIEHEDQEEDTEPIMGPLTGYQHFVFSKYMTPKAPESPS